MQWVNYITQPAFGVSLLRWWGTPTRKLFWFIQAVGELPAGAQFPGLAGWVSFEGHLQLRSSHPPGKWISRSQAFSFLKILMLSGEIEGHEKDSGMQSSLLQSPDCTSIKTAQIYGITTQAYQMVRRLPLTFRKTPNPNSSALVYVS